MKNCVIIGKTNVGKTLFLINFASYLGLRHLDFISLSTKGPQQRRRYTSKNAILKLTNNSPHKTLENQSIMLDLPLGKGKKKVQLVDTTGLMDGIHPKREVRHAISNTLAIIRDAHLILHMMDASIANDYNFPKTIGEIDYHIAHFAQIRRGYAILANKIDLPGAHQGLKEIRREFPNNIIFPISAKYKKGFKEVKVFVAHGI